MAIDSQHDIRPDAAKRFSKDDTHFALGRIAAFQYFIAAIFLFLISGFWVLQVRDGESNQLADATALSLCRCWLRAASCSIATGV
jgi:hypothetical protein